MNRRWFLAGLALVVAGGVAEARMHTPYRGHRIVPAGGAVLDGFTQPSGAYSFRKLISTYAGSAVKLQRVDTTTLDVGFTATGDFDTAAAAAFCTTACTVNTWYDQSGLGRHLTQATAANQPAYVASCNGARPCAQFTQTAQTLLGTSFTPTTQIATLNAVASRPVGTLAGGAFLRENGNSNRIIPGVANIWSLGSGPIAATAADAAWHSAIGVMVVAAGGSVFSIDGTEVTGTTTPALTGGNPGIVGFTGSTLNIGELAFWDGYALTPAERTALTNNQRNYWMPAPLDSFTQPSGAYSFRKLKSAYAGPAIRIRRASDQAELDINFLGCTGFTGCPWDEAAASAHCAATTCFGVTWYAQAGALNLTQATAANQPQLIFNCNGALPCLRFTAGTMTLQSAGTFTPSAIVSPNLVAKRASGTGGCFFRLNGGASNNVGFRNGTAGMNLAAAVGSITTISTEGVWHTAMGTINGASSSFSVDGATSTGSITTVLTAGVTTLFGAATTTCDVGEAIVWDNYTLTAGDVAGLTTNQRSYGWVP